MNDHENHVFSKIIVSGKDSNQTKDQLALRETKMCLIWHLSSEIATHRWWLNINGKYPIVNCVEQNATIFGGVIFQDTGVIGSGKDSYQRKDHLGLRETKMGWIWH